MGKKSFGSNTNIEIDSWFWFPIPKPGFGCTLQMVGDSKLTLDLLIFSNSTYGFSH